MFITPFLLGLAGSLHCVGMCSPLVMAATGTGKKAVFRSLLYNIGRITTYGLLGGIVSFAGMGLSFAGLQQVLAIGAGIVILVVGIANINVKVPSFVSRPLAKFISMIRQKFCRLINNSSPFSTVLLGMLNGLLPCGMTLVALGYCLTIEWPADGFMAMIYFGLGTLPAMFGLSSVLKAVVRRIGIGYKPLQTALMIISGVLLIGRGIANHDIAHHHADDDGIVVCDGSRESK